MKKFTILLLVLIAIPVSAYSQKLEIPSFDFPNTKMGDFAKEWFKSINENDLDLLKKYNTQGEWDDHLNVIINIAKKVKGIVPYQISYETNELISIFSKENNDSYVKVKLGLNKKNEITEISIRKSVKPVNYEMQNNLSIQDIEEIVNGISDELKKNYAVEKFRIPYSNEVIKLLKSGKYNSIKQGDLLADVLTKDLVKLSNDKHLQIISPSKINEVINRFGLTDESSNNDLNLDESLLESSKIELREKSDKPVLEAHSESLVDEMNEKYISYEKLEKNIGYINMTRFVNNEKTNNETEVIFEELKGAKAIIIDLRYSGGGDGKATDKLLSYFLKGGKTNTDTQKLYYKKPLYVLTSKKTISAGEAFAYRLKQQKRATIVGEITAGAGYRVDVYKLPNDFYFVNSIHNSFDSEKGEGWQGVGIKPDFQISSQDALIKAISLINKS